jgi:hypothetical protein
MFSKDLIGSVEIFIITLKDIKKKISTSPERRSV